MTELRPTERFSDRVEDYIKYRPRYPAGIIPLLESEAGLAQSQVIADVGSGTGILSELFLAHGNRVYGIEPNAKMREAAERLLARYPAFESIDATAEKTTLPSTSVDLVTAGQAFHWFDPKVFKVEVQRILRPGGFVVLIWNDRKESTDFGKEYEAILEKYGTDYAAVAAKYRYGEDPVREFFSEGQANLKMFPNEQKLDFAAFRGRMLSASYAPPPGHPKHGPMIKALEEMFAKYVTDGVVRMEYDTKVFYGKVGP